MRASRARRRPVGLLTAILVLCGAAPMRGDLRSSQRQLVPAVTVAGKGRCSPVALGGRPALMRGHEVRFASRLQAISDALAGPRADVLMLGDSITQQWPDATLQSAFPKRRIINAGVSGDTTGAIIARLSGQTTEVRRPEGNGQVAVTGWARQSPRLVVVLIGTNDLRFSDACNVMRGIVAAAQRAGALYPAARIAVLGVLPRGADGRDQAGLIADINRALPHELATLGPRFSFVETAKALSCPPRGSDDCGGMRRPPNYVHLTPVAYERFAALLRQALPMR